MTENEALHAIIVRTTDPDALLCAMRAANVTPEEAFHRRALSGKTPWPGRNP